MSLAAFNVGNILDRIAETLDLPFALQAEAERQYRLVGEYLSDQSVLADWDIYPQGSARLGTVVRPLVGGAGFDLDMVCRIEIAKESTTEAEPKERVGKALTACVEANSTAPGAPEKCEPSRRYWTLYYPSDFHMDVLPAIPDVEALPTGILLTDKQLRYWQRSNPIAYATWFRQQMEQQFNRRRKMLATEARKSIDAIPEWQVRTTLQRVVQVLKRHRASTSSTILTIGRPLSLSRRSSLGSTRAKRISSRRPLPRFARCPTTSRSMPRATASS